MIERKLPFGDGCMILTYPKEQIHLDTLDGVVERFANWKTSDPLPPGIDIVWKAGQKFDACKYVDMSCQQK